jgi:type IV pilus assembly protein PilC
MAGVKALIPANWATFFFESFMLGSSRIDTKTLAGICRRLAISLDAGIDARRVWHRESERVRGSARTNLEAISHDIDRGVLPSDAVDARGEYFPDLFRAMVRVGDRSGHQPEVFRQLAERYEFQIKLRRNFISEIWWPMFQLAAALFVIGLLIWVMGIIAPPKEPGGPPTIDLLGLGLAGTDGLLTYLGFLAVVAIAIAIVVRAILRGALWVGPVQRLVLRIPKLGRVFETLAISKLAWTLQLTHGAGMELKEALRLSLISTRNARYSGTADEVWSHIRRGTNLREALEATAEYPQDFLDAIEVGEESGRLPESLQKLAEHYEEEARMSLAILTKILGFAVWGLVAIIIVMMIFRLASFYLGVINDALGGI